MSDPNNSVGEGRAVPPVQYVFSIVGIHPGTGEPNGMELCYTTTGFIGGWYSTQLGYHEDSGPYFSLPEALRRAEQIVGESAWRPHVVTQRVAVPPVEQAPESPDSAKFTSGSTHPEFEVWWDTFGSVLNLGPKMSSYYLAFAAWIASADRAKTERVAVPPALEEMPAHFGLCQVAERITSSQPVLPPAVDVEPTREWYEKRCAWYAAELDRVTAQRDALEGAMNPQDASEALRASRAPQPTTDERKS